MGSHSLNTGLSQSVPKTTTIDNKAEIDERMFWRWKIRARS